VRVASRPFSFITRVSRKIGAYPYAHRSNLLEGSALPCLFGAFFLHIFFPSKRGGDRSSAGCSSDPTVSVLFRSSA
jgi:hypothetical protein